MKISKLTKHDRVLIAALIIVLIAWISSIVLIYRMNSTEPMDTATMEVFVSQINCSRDGSKTIIVENTKTGGTVMLEGDAYFEALKPYLGETVFITQKNGKYIVLR